LMLNLLRTGQRTLRDSYWSTRYLPNCPSLGN